MKKSILLIFCFAVSFFACKKDDNSTKPSYYMNFTYNNKQYNIKDMVTFTNEDNAYGIIGIDQNMNMLTISSSLKLEKGKTYDILSGTTTIPPSTVIMLTADLIGDQSAVDAENPTKIGELIINELTSEIITGKFSCKMMKGNISNGDFSAKFDNSQKK